MSTRSSDTEVVYQDPAQYLSASISSLSSQRAQMSWIAKSYRHATELFLTRRLNEALDAITPVVEPTGDDRRPRSAEPDVPLIAPVASSSKGTRVKVWSFYSTLLDAIIQLGPEEGALALGASRWTAIADQARQGLIWDRVVNLGYRGAEGTVDGEVVANLSTLLLSHMCSQKLNQQKLESYLAASAMPVFDFSHMTASQDSRPGVQQSRSRDGTSTPRDLNTRLKIIELYTLHVLPRNNEWDYAREFIDTSEVLDDERREAFQHALQSLREEQNHEALRQTELKQRQAAAIEHERVLHDERQASKVHQAPSAKSPDLHQALQNSHRKTRPPTRQRASTIGSSISARDKKTPRQAAKTPPDHKRPDRPPPGSVAPASDTLYGRATSVWTMMRTALTGRNISMHASSLRLLLFILAFAFALARKNVRDTARRMGLLAFGKVTETVGMGLRVTYI